MIIVTTGSRSWKDRRTIYKRLSELPPGSSIIVGDARGADTLVVEAAKQLGYSFSKEIEPGCYTIYHPDWNKYGKAAGPIRNREMIANNPDLVLVFRAPGRSKGTDDTKKMAEDLSIPTEVYFERRDY